jgi:P-type E1-E2 ATPase
LQDGVASLTAPGVETDVDLLVVGDLIKVINGQIVPLDGMVVFGSGCCNESMLTGEAKPQKKSIGVKVYGGTMLTQGSFVVRVDKLGE